MGKNLCFTFATLVLVTLTDFIAAEYIVPVDRLSVEQVNEWWPGLIPNTADVISSAKSWFILQNLWDFISPYLRNIQGVDKSLLTPSQVSRQLFMTLLFDLSTDEQEMPQLRPIRHLMYYAKNVMNDESDDKTAMSVLENIDLWTAVKDGMYPLVLEVNDLTMEQKRHFVKDLIACSSADNTCVCDNL